MNDKRMKLRYDGTCRLCGTALPARAEAIYERDTKTVRCVTCEATEPEPAVEPARDATAAGGSARREYERRKAAREERVRAREFLAAEGIRVG